MTSDQPQRVLEILAAISRRPAADLRREDHLTADLGIDSPLAIELLFKLQQDLGLTVREEEAAALETVGDLLDLAARQGLS